MTDDPSSSLPPLPRFTPDERVCGNCKLWQPHSVDARGWVGPCRIQPQRGLFPGSAPICDAFVGKGTSTVVVPVQTRPRAPRTIRSVAPQVIRHQADGSAAPAELVVKHEFARQEVARLDPNTAVDLGGELSMTREELMDLFREAAGENPAPPLANKWEGGHIQLVPGKSDVQGKELPIDAFFHKIVMVRDRLRTLEQKVNAHPKLSDAEKVEMQHYITRVYGSLTSFNVMFRDKQDQFIGAKGDE